VAKRLRRTCALLAALSLSAAAALGCTGGTTSKTPKQAAVPENAPRTEAVEKRAEVPNQISIDNFTFDPPKLTVAVGTKVTWLNRDDVPHTATSSVKPRQFDSGTLDTDDHFEHVFTTPGVYDYFCAVHPHMTGQIIVK
jgi:plastocyanin